MRPSIVAPATGCLFAVSLAALPAATAGAHPSQLAHLRVTGVTHRTLTVKVDSVGSDAHYRLFVSTNRSHMAPGALSKDSSVGSRHSQLTISGLRFVTRPYYFRVTATTSHGKQYSAIGSAWLRPTAPTKLASGSRRGVPYLTWDAGTNTGFTVVQATNRGFTSGRTTYRLAKRAQQLTPYGLDKGTSYWFKVIARNGPSRSQASKPVSIVGSGPGQHVRVMTYNILKTSSDGTHEGDGTIAPWSERVGPAADLVDSVTPDVVDIEEGAEWIGSPGHTRQVDSLLAHLSSNYRLARTEIPPGEPHAKRTANYIIYNNDTMRAVGNGGYWRIGDGKFAVYQILANRASGAKFVNVCVHTYVGNGVKIDKMRKAEVDVMIHKASKYAAAHKLPVVYGGDMNSADEKKIAYDGPGISARAHHFADARGVAQRQHDAKWDSANQYLRKPIAAYTDIDHIFAPPGVSVQGFGVVVKIAHGQYQGVIPSDHNPIYADLTYPA